MPKVPFFVSLLLPVVLSLSAASAGRFEPRPQGPRYCRTDPAKSLVLFENGKAVFEIVHGA